MSLRDDRVAEGGNNAWVTMPPQSDSVEVKSPARPVALEVEGSSGSSMITPISPSDLKPLASVAASTKEQVRLAVEAARFAQERWREETLDKRIAAITRAAKNMLRRRAEVIELAREEMGKVEAEGIFNEALGPLDAIGGWAKVVRAALPRKQVRLNPLNFPKKQAHVDLIPRGVVGVIAPWNFPVAGLYRATLPALMSGNGLVLKPSEYTPRTSAWFIERLAEELPAGLVSVVQGAGEVGAALVDSGIDACVFTGSPTTGHKVAIQCAEKGIPSSIEMGGKDPAIVLADCDLARTAAAITHWTLSNVGQACGAIREIAYVEESIADAFVEKLRSAWTKLRVGQGRTFDIGPLANQRQFDRVRDQVADAVAKGAVVVCGGKATGEGLGYLPTLLDRCTDEMAVVRDETFGPLLAVIRVEGAAEAIRRTNQGRYGLGASIWTRDFDRAGRLAERLEVGVVNINNHSFSGAIPTLPWSGTRETGFGVANSAYALSTFVRPKATLIDRNTGPEVYWLPYDHDLLDLGNILADAQVFRLAKAWRLPILMRRRMQTVRKFFGWK